MRGGRIETPGRRGACSLARAEERFCGSRPAAAAPTHPPRPIPMYMYPTSSPPHPAGHRAPISSPLLTDPFPPQAELQFSGKRHHLGTWASEVDAARAYDRAAREHVPKGKAIFNFPHSTAAPAAPRATVGSASRRKRQRRAGSASTPAANDVDAALEAAHRLHGLASLSALAPYNAASSVPFGAGDGGGVSPRYGGGVRPRSMSAGRYPGSFWGTERQSAMLLAEQESMVQRQRLWQQQQALLQQAHFQQMLMAQRAFAAAAAAATGATMRPPADVKPPASGTSPAAPPTGAETTPRASAGSAQVLRGRAMSLGSASAAVTPSVSVAAKTSSTGDAPVKVHVSSSTQTTAAMAVVAVAQSDALPAVTPPCTPSAAVKTKAVTNIVDGVVRAPSEPSATTEA